MSIPMPEVQANAGIYLLQWPEVTVMVERLAENHQNITGEMTIHSKLVGYDGLIEKTRINLLSDQARKRLASTCAERVDELDWVNYIKMAAILVVENHRKGEPVVELGGKPETMALDYRLEPVLEEGQPSTIFGAGSSCKSYLADFTAVLTQYGIAGMGRWAPKQGNALILDWETSEHEHRRRIYAIKKGLGIEDEPDTIAYRFCTQPLADDIVEIQRIVLDREIDFAIVDSQVAATGGDIEKAEAANNYYNALRTLRRTTLTIDHQPKNTDNGRPMPFGSVFKYLRARSVFELRAVQEPGASFVELGLYHRKHNEGRVLAPMGIRVDFKEVDDVLEKVTFSPCEIRDIPELVKGLTLKAKITAVLRDGAITAADIADQVDSTAASVRTILNRHKDTFVKADPYAETWGLLHGDNE